MPPIVDPALAEAFTFFTNTGVYELDTDAKIRRLQTPPASLEDFQKNLVAFIRHHTTSQLPRIDHPADRPGGVVERVIDKARLLQTLDYFESRGCRCLKTCFGLDACLNPRLVASGSFFTPSGDATPDLIDTVYTYETASGKHRGTYLLDFTAAISPGRAMSLLTRYETLAPLSDLHGYVMDIVTYRRLLTEDAHLGPAAQLRLRFGMNTPGIDGDVPAPSGRSQIMMFEVAAADVAGLPPFYVYATAIMNDADATECPPRQPCNPAPDEANP
jgi:hypothetical protein